MKIKKMTKKQLADRMMITEKIVTSRMIRSKHLIPPPIPDHKPPMWDEEVVSEWEKGERYFYGEYHGKVAVQKKPKTNSEKLRGFAKYLA